MKFMTSQDKDYGAVSEDGISCQIKEDIASERLLTKDLGII